MITTRKPRLTKLRGKKLFGLILRKIKRNPKCWDQEYSHCKSAHCVFGWAELLATGRESLYAHETLYKGRMLFRLNREDADYAWNFNRTLPELEAFYEKMKD